MDSFHQITVGSVWVDVDEEVVVEEAVQYLDGTVEVNGVEWNSAEDFVNQHTRVQ